MNTLKFFDGFYQEGKDLDENSPISVDFINNNKNKWIYG